MFNSFLAEVVLAIFIIASDVTQSLQGSQMKRDGTELQLWLWLCTLRFSAPGA